jgi:hypothetical protein
MSAWSDIEPVAGNAPKLGVRVSMRQYRGGTWVLAFRFFDDVQSECEMTGSECYRIAIPAGEAVDRVRLIRDRTGPFEAKESSRGSAVRLSATGLCPADGKPWNSTAASWKIVDGDKLEVTLPSKVARARK